MLGTQTVDPSKYCPSCFKRGKKCWTTLTHERKQHSHVLSVTTTVSPNDARFENTMVINVEDIKDADIVSHLKLAIEFITYARLERKSVWSTVSKESLAAVQLYWRVDVQSKATLYQAWHYVEGICRSTQIQIWV